MPPRPQYMEILKLLVDHALFVYTYYHIISNNQILGVLTDNKYVSGFKLPNTIYKSAVPSYLAYLFDSS